LNSDIVIDTFNKIQSVKQNAYSFNVNYYRDHLNKVFDRNHPFAHPIAVINDFTNRNTFIRIGLQFSKNPHLVNGFNIISDMTLDSEEKNQFISKYFITYDERSLNLLSLGEERKKSIDLFLKNINNVKAINKTIKDAFYYPNIIKKN
jgi:hypothetical protein